MDAVNPLNYAPAPPPQVQFRRKAIKWTILAGGLATAWLCGPSTLRWIEFLYWQNRCMNFSLPPSQIVVDTSSSANPSPRLVSPLPQFAQFVDFQLDGWPLVFMHQMRRPDGQMRLVVISMQHARVWTPGYFGTPPANDSYHSQADLTNAIQIHAGQLDPTNASHLTINYISRNGKPAVMDGFLGNDDRLLLSTRP
jgi:hypothetical protein